MSARTFGFAWIVGERLVLLGHVLQDRVRLPQLEVAVDQGRKGGVGIDLQKLWGFVTAAEVVYVRFLEADASSG